MIHFRLCHVAGGFTPVEIACQRVPGLGEEITTGAGPFTVRRIESLIGKLPPEITQGETSLLVDRITVYVGEWELPP